EDGIRDDLVTGVQTCALPIWFRHSHLTVSVSHLGAGSVRVCAGAGCDVTRRRVEKIRALRTPAPCPPAASRRRALLEPSADHFEIGRASCRERGVVAVGWGLW